MRPTQMLRSGAADPKNGQLSRNITVDVERIADEFSNSYIGNWGHFGGEKQRGIITYGLSANRQNPWAGSVNDAIFNTFRRTKNQIFFWLPPMVAGYWMMSWAIERSEYLNSKAGRAEFGDEEE
ncbi:ubiquinol-cytochrome c reductase subunit 8 [Fusarium sporotrichioides]|uniref:Cytochrome b-c1 complex subunit 8 n=1 Tax=Fusarium sporotrichioides TaxID=5514 RepID=A0A395RX76_FUSSP|nr:ubiquinol-cytochrome c reductase subunit 8 [Fusarium sporotrichioides]